MAWSGQFKDLAASTPYQGHPRANTPKESAQGGPQVSVISQLSPGIWTHPIIGVIIGKGEPRCVPSKKESNIDRYVINITLRDSARDFMNVNCWGGQEYANELATQYHIGDVVEVNNAAVQSKPTDGSDERFRPATPSPYQLSLSEKKSTMKQYGGWSSNRYTKLLHIPTKPTNDFFTLADVMTNGHSLHGDHISIMAAVRNVGPAKDITTKAGRHIKRCEVKLFDETAASFALVLWDEELIQMAQTWQPKDNVLFAADVRVTHDDFRKAMIATATAKSIITVNPDSREAYNLYQYAKSAQLHELDVGYGGPAGAEYADLTNIQDVHTVKEIKEKFSGSTSGVGTNCGIVYAAVTALNLDSDPERSIVTKCKRCRRRVEPGLVQCMNMECPIGSAMGLGVEQDLETSLSLQMALSDHTGTLNNCSLQGEVAAKMLQCSVDDYLGMVEEARTQLKWDFLLERCKIYYKVQPATADWPQPRVLVLSCERGDPQAAASHLR